MKEFSPTHRIFDGRQGEWIPVVATEPLASGTPLYTREEWDACDLADWEFSDEDGLTFQGQTGGFRLFPVEA